METLEFKKNSIQLRTLNAKAHKHFIIKITLQKILHVSQNTRNENLFRIIPERKLNYAT